MPNADAYIVLGTIGSGKTVQATKLQQLVGGQALSVGSLIRQSLKSDPRVARGELLPHDEVVAIVAEAISAVADSQPIIFDGFPRKLQQKKWLDDYLAKHNRPLTAVIYLQVDESEVDRRLAVRARADDTPQAIASRKQWFIDDVLPVLNAYEEDGKLKTINGNLSPEEVTRQIHLSIEN